MRGLSGTRRRAWLIAAAAGVVAVALLLGVWATTSGPPTAADGEAALPTRVATAGPVEVRVTPQRVDTGAVLFSVVLDNHEVALEGDYAASSTLTVGGTPWSTARWNGAGPGGHHREGTLTFSPPAAPPADGAPSGELALELGGLPEPLTLRWTLTASGS